MVGLIHPREMTSTEERYETGLAVETTVAPGVFRTCGYDGRGRIELRDADGRDDSPLYVDDRTITCVLGIAWRKIW